MNIVKRLQERDVSNAKGATLEREAVEHINSIERELQSTVADANKYNRIIAPGYNRLRQTPTMSTCIQCVNLYASGFQRKCWLRYFAVWLYQQ